MESEWNMESIYIIFFFGLIFDDWNDQRVEEGRVEAKIDTPYTLSSNSKGEIKLWR